MTSASCSQSAPERRLTSRARRHLRRQVARLTELEAERVGTRGYVVVPNPSRRRGTVAYVVQKSPERRRLEADVRAARASQEENTR